MKSKKIINYILFSIAFLLFIFLFIKVRNLGIIPNKYVFLFTIIELILLITGFILGRLKKLVYYIISTVLLVLIIIVNSFGFYYVKHLDIFIDKGFTGEIVNTNTFYIITSKSNDVKSLDDVSIDRTINFYVNSRHIEEAKEKLGEEYSYNPVENLLEYLKTNKDNNSYLIVGDLNYNACVELNEDINEEDYKVIDTIDIKTTEKRNEEVKDSYNILILGKDFSDSRDDLNMLVTINTKTHKALFTSMPRDLYMPVFETNFKNSLTFMYLYGEEIQLKSIEQFYGIEIDYKFILYTENLVDVVDKIGGVEFCSDRAFTTTHAQIMNYNDKTGKKLRISKGCQTLNGIEALTVARERIAFNPSGDRQRQVNCRQLLINILKKIASTSTLSNYSEILDSLNGLYKTTMNRNTAVRLIRSVIDNNGYEIIEQNLSGEQYMKPLGNEGWVSYAIVAKDKDIENVSHKILEVLNEE